MLSARRLRGNKSYQKEINHNAYHLCNITTSIAFFSSSKEVLSLSTLATRINPKPKALDYIHACMNATQHLIVYLPLFGQSLLPSTKNIFKTPSKHQEYIRPKKSHRLHHTTTAPLKNAMLCPYINPWVSINYKEISAIATMDDPTHKPIAKLATPTLHFQT